MKFNILIAEDEDSIREILVSIVEMLFMQEFPFLDLNISPAANGQEALEIVKDEYQDIILSDVVMPVMDGLEFIKKVRLFDKSVPILVLSALSSYEDVDKIMNSGASNYTTKPLNAKLFTAQIKVFVDFYLRRQNKYNNSAINLFSKNIYKRKTEFLIEKENDLFEFWEFLTRDNDDQYQIESTLQYIYNVEILMIKSGISNSIILEENNEEFYLTLSNLNKLDDSLINDLSKKYSIHSLKHKQDGFFDSFMLCKTMQCQNVEQKQEIIKEKTEDKLTKIEQELKAAMLKDIRYTVHEKISPDVFLSEMDSVYEDKVENFLEDMNLLTVCIFDLEDSNPKDARVYVKQITKYFYNFSIIVESIGLFNVISRSLTVLASFLEDIDDEIIMDSERKVLLSQMLKSVGDNLESWIRTIFIDKNTSDIHYFDASFSDNCFLIISTFLNQESEEEDCEDDDDSLDFF